MRRWSRTAGRCVLAALMVLLAVGCANDDEPVAEASPTPTAPPMGIDAGRHFGYIVSIDLEASTIVFDEAQFLSGDEANEAAREDGYIDEGDTVPNDYYIRALDTGERTVPLADDVEVVVVDWANCCETTEGEVEPFAAGFEEGADPSGPYRGSTSPYWITVEGDHVVKIEEQYLP